MKYLILICFGFLSACASSPNLEPPKNFTSSECRSDFSAAHHLPTEKQLNQVTRLFSDDCYQEVIQLGRYIRAQNHDKFYSVSSEFLELFVPEGAVTPYVLESYERGYLSLLISLSHFNLNQPELAAIELRRTNSEEKAILYNYGDDPVLTLLQAAILDRVHPEEARPFWKKFSEFKIESEIQKFAINRIREIDANSTTPVRWKIYSCGRLPDYDWQLSLWQFYRISPTSIYPVSHAEEATLTLSTQSWNKKIIGKYKSGYHPYLFAKSVMRLTTGIAYGVVGVASGATIGLGGCVVGASSKNDTGELCKVSLEAGGFLISKSADLVSFTLKPDLRRWSALPDVVKITRAAEFSDNSVACSNSGSMSPEAQTLLQ